MWIWVTSLAREKNFFLSDPPYNSWNDLLFLGVSINRQHLPSCLVQVLGFVTLINDTVWSEQYYWNVINHTVFFSTKSSMCHVHASCIAWYDISVQQWDMCGNGTSLIRHTFGSKNYIETIHKSLMMNSETKRHLLDPKTNFTNILWAPCSNLVKMILLWPCL